MTAAREHTRQARERRELLAPVQRWGHSRKAALCRAIRAGHVSIEEAAAAHRLSAEELSIWLAAHERFGAEGLKICKRLMRSAA